MWGAWARAPRPTLQTAIGVTSGGVALVTTEVKTSEITLHDSARLGAKVVFHSARWGASGLMAEKSKRMGWDSEHLKEITSPLTASYTRCIKNNPDILKGVTEGASVYLDKNSSLTTEYFCFTELDENAIRHLQNQVGGQQQVLKGDDPIPNHATVVVAPEGRGLTIPLENGVLLIVNDTSGTPLYGIAYTHMHWYKANTKDAVDKARAAMALEGYENLPVFVNGDLNAPVTEEQRKSTWTLCKRSRGRSRKVTDVSILFPGMIGGFHLHAPTGNPNTHGGDNHGTLCYAGGTLMCVFSERYTSMVTPTLKKAIREKLGEAFETQFQHPTDFRNDRLYDLYWQTVFEILREKGYTDHSQITINMRMYILRNSLYTYLCALL